MRVMRPASPLVGREREQVEVLRAIAMAQRGQGGLLLLAGEAGVGKTRLARETLEHSELLVLYGEGIQEATPPYGPLIAAVRSFLRREPKGLAGCGSSSGHLALLLPELGPASGGADRGALFEAVRCAFEAIARREPAVVFLDDLQWADNATLEILPALAGALEYEPLLLLGAYRNDEIPRGHPLRRMRTDLRRTGRLRELPVEPLDQEETALLVARVLGQAPSGSLASTIYHRTQGVPFFVEELATALAGSRRLTSGRSGVELAAGENVPIPDTVRDAVLLRVEGLSPQARRVLDVAAVAGVQFDLEIITALAGEEGFEEVVERGLIVEVAPGLAAFRHALMREALYGEVAWTRRRALHRDLAARLEARGALPRTVAEHWLAGREPDRARRALLAAVEASCKVHAYRDAAHEARRALELWPEGQDEMERLGVLEQLGHCAQVSGDLAEATRAWQEAAEIPGLAGDPRRLGQIRRSLATVYELQGVLERAIVERKNAADAFAASGLPAETAADRLSAARHLSVTGRFTAALDLIAIARQEADQVGRPDLRARALGLEGSVRTRLGQFEAGLELIRTALSTALAENLTELAADAYFRLAGALEQTASYPAAQEAYRIAFDFCQSRGVAATAQSCLSCIALMLRETGEWERAMVLCREVRASPEATASSRAVAGCVLGSLHAFRGESGRARGLLTEALEFTRLPQVASLGIQSTWGLAVVEDLEAHYDAAAELCRALLKRWEQTEDRHYAVAPLRWATGFFAVRGAGQDARACTDALTRIAAASGTPDALAALAHALGELALLDGDAGRAASHFLQALEHLRVLEVPFERAQTQLRLGVALVATGEREAAVDRLTDAYLTARRLRARPLAAAAARELAALGESVTRRLGRRDAGQLRHGGLSGREVEVVRLVAVGRTNREIAQELFLSPRTVDMHVRNILAKLDCRSRAEATRKAGELGLLENPTG